VDKDMAKLHQRFMDKRAPLNRRLISPVRRFLVLGIATLAALGHSAATGRQQATPQEEEGRANLEAGRRRFGKTCANQFCHQLDGGGEGPTSLRNRHLTIDQAKQIISNGLRGTAMPPFKNTLQPEEIAQLAAFVVSLSSPTGGAPPAAGVPAKPAPEASGMVIPRPKASPFNTYTAAGEASVGGNAAAGRSIFFDDTQSGTCAACHRFQGMGGKVGPDLTKVSSKSPAEIMDSIVHPRLAADPVYAPMALTTRQGERYLGIKRDETNDTIRLYDTSCMPPVSRTFLRTDVVTIETLNVPTMPADYAARYSHEELLDLVTFLKVGGPNPNLMFPHARTRSTTKARD
jgi:putative heme-binding domain-containing protein